MIERFINILKTTGIDLDYRQIEETLWLARLLTIGAPAASTSELDEIPPTPQYSPETEVNQQKDQALTVREGDQPSPFGKPS